MRTLTLILIALGATSVVAEDKKEPFRELELKVKLEPMKGKVGEPAKISSKDELAKAVEDKDTRAAIAQAIDFEKEYLLIFQWAGSGGDKLTAATEKDGVVFTKTFGRTKDLRQHAHFFAIAKDAKWSMAK